MPVAAFATLHLEVHTPDNPAQVFSVWGWILYRLNQGLSVSRRDVASWAGIGDRQARSILADARAWFEGFHGAPGGAGPRVAGSTSAEFPEFRPSSAPLAPQKRPKSAPKAPQVEQGGIGIADDDRPKSAPKAPQERPTSAPLPPQLFPAVLTSDLQEQYIQDIQEPKTSLGEGARGRGFCVDQPGEEPEPAQTPDPTPKPEPQPPAGSQDAISRRQEPYRARQGRPNLTTAAFAPNAAKTALAALQTRLGYDPLADCAEDPALIRHGAGIDVSALEADPRQLQVFRAWWRRTTNPTACAMFDAPRQQLISAALKDYTAAELAHAIRWAFEAPVEAMGSFGHWYSRNRAQIALHNVLEPTRLADRMQTALAWTPGKPSAPAAESATPGMADWGGAAWTESVRQHWGKVAEAQSTTPIEEFPTDDE